MFSVIVSDRKSDMENRQAIRPEQRKLFPSDYFSRNFSLMIISLNGRIFTPVLFLKWEGGLGPLSDSPGSTYEWTNGHIVDSRALLNNRRWDGTSTE